MWEYKRTGVPTYSVITKGGVIYLKDRSPYLDSLSFFIVNLKIQLKLIYWELTLQSILTLRRVCLHYLA